MFFLLLCVCVCALLFLYLHFILVTAVEINQGDVFVFTSLFCVCVCRFVLIASANCWPHFATCWKTASVNSGFRAAIPQVVNWFAGRKPRLDLCYRMEHQAAMFPQDHCQEWKTRRLQLALWRRTCAATFPSCR